MFSKAEEGKSGIGRAIQNCWWGWGGATQLMASQYLKASEARRPLISFFVLLWSWSWTQGHFEVFWSISEDPTGGVSSLLSQETASFPLDNQTHTVIDKFLLVYYHYIISPLSNLIFHKYQFHNSWHKKQQQNKQTTEQIPPFLWVFVHLWRIPWLTKH